MSFQDVGKSGPKRTTTRHLQTSAPLSEESLTNSGSDGYSQISDGLLQYQRNVGILEKITKQVGTKSDNSVLETQNRVQVDVLRQLGGKLEGQLRAQDKLLQSLGRTEAAKPRATHVKLTRDYRTVEATFQTIQLDYRRRRARVVEQQGREEQDNRDVFGDASARGSGGGEIHAIQQQMQQDRMNEEIMREREEEIRNINRGMHTVNEIYKDLANIVGNQQEQVDQVESQMEETKVRTQDGLTHIQKASAKASEANCTIS